MPTASYLAASLLAVVTATTAVHVTAAADNVACPDADGPLMAVYHNETWPQAVLAQGGTPPDPADRPVLVLWREGGDNPRVALQKTHIGITELWNRTTDGSLRKVRLFDTHRRAVEFEARARSARDASEWRALYHLVDPTALTPIGDVGRVDTRAASAVAGADCDATTRLQGRTVSVQSAIDWHATLALPSRYEQQAIRTPGVSQRWRLVEWHQDAAAIAERFTDWDRYDAVDFADIGDNESDPFLQTMINLGFIEHGGNNFYDSQGRVLTHGHWH